jgi:hypothetical protein
MIKTFHLSGAANCVPSNAGKVNPIDPQSGCPMKVVCLGRGMVDAPKKGEPCSANTISPSFKNFVNRCQNRSWQSGLFFIARTPGISVNALLKTLGVSKQALNGLEN